MNVIALTTIYCDSTNNNILCNNKQSNIEQNFSNELIDINIYKALDTNIQNHKLPMEYFKDSEYDNIIVLNTFIKLIKDKPYLRDNKGVCVMLELLEEQDTNKIFKNHKDEIINILTPN